MASLFLLLLNRPTSSSRLVIFALREAILNFWASNLFDITEYRLLVEGLLFFPKSLI